MLSLIFLACYMLVLEPHFLRIWITRISLQCLCMDFEDRKSVV